MTENLTASVPAAGRPLPMMNHNGTLPIDSAGMLVGAYLGDAAFRERVAKRLRSHIRVLSQPTARIHREVCFSRHDQQTDSEAHHVDYSRPFLIVWACRSCHERIEAGLLNYRLRDLWDYSSLVIKRETRTRVAQQLDTADASVPF